MPEAAAPPKAPTPEFVTVVAAALPATIKRFLAEADGCVKHGLVLGAIVCSQQALDELLTLQGATGADRQARLAALATTHPGIPPQFLTILQQLGPDRSSDVAQNLKTCRPLTLTLKATLYEIYVLGARREEVERYVKRQLEEHAGVIAPPAAAVSETATAATKARVPTMNTSALSEPAPAADTVGASGSDRG